MKTALRAAQPQNELYEQLTALGWSLSNIDRKNGLYVATGTGPAEQPAERVGQTPTDALAALLLYAQRSNAVRRMASISKLASWTGDWLDDWQEIARAYAEAPAFDEKAIPAFRALASESKLQADAIRQQIKVDVSDNPDPYVNMEEMCKDVHQNKHFEVSRANAQHPVWSSEDVINFRIVHDVLGHCQSGGDFSWTGENLACKVHMPLVSPLAREALFTECIGQTAYNKAYHGYGPQKAVLLSDFLSPVQEKEGEHVFVPHGGMPALNAPNQTVQTEMIEPPEQKQAPSFSPAMMGVHGDGSIPVTKPWFKSKVEAKLVSDNLPNDPNANYQTPSELRSPAITSQDPNDYIGISDTIKNASKVDTEWWTKDDATQKRAIMNAFRVAILSPRKHLKWNAAHYQALMHTDPNTSAMEMWHLLEEQREKHNQGLGHPEGSHLRYRKNLEFLADQLQQEKGLSPAEGMAEAKRIVFDKIKEFEAQLGRQHDMGETSELRRYNMARKLVEQWMMDNHSPGAGWMPGQMALASDQTEKMVDDLSDYLQDEWSEEIGNPTSDHPGNEDAAELAIRLLKKGADEWSNQPLFDMPTEQAADATGFGGEDAKYGAFMGTHLDALAQVGSHIQQIQDAALQDIQQGDGKGMTFRNDVMNMNLPGVNPKVCSFAWLLLRPMSSDLGIIDAHMLRGLDRGEGDMSVRDYYKLERMQRAAKDSSGYSHMPLGLYHWGLWDHIRNPGQHSDHSPLRVLDPTPWDTHPWDAATSARSGTILHPSYMATKQNREAVGNQFEQEFAGQPLNMVPYSKPEEDEGDYMVSPFVIPHPGSALSSSKPR